MAANRCAQALKSSPPRKACRFNPLNIMLPDQKLDALVTRHAALERDLASALPPETFVKLSREFAELAPVVEAVNSYRAAQRELEGLTSLIDDPSTDAEMRSIAAEEKPEL